MKKKLSFSLLAAILGLGVGMAVVGCQTEQTSSPVTSNSENVTSNSQESAGPTSSSKEEHVHEWGEPTWAWTKAGDSYTAKATFTCTKDSTHTETVDATVAKGEAKNPTCTEAGSASFTATASHGGKTFTDTKTDALSALNHDLVHHDAKAATCTEKGWAAYDTCSRCDYTTYKEIAALGHKYSTEWTTSENEHWHVCTNSGCTEISDKAAHTLKTRESITNPTCSLEGTKKIETYCEVCGLVTNIQTEDINKVDHNYVLDEAKSVNPTCTTPGKKVYTCSMCQDSYSETLTALGHDFKYVSCTEPYKCSRCEATKEAPGHAYKLDEEHSHPVSCGVDGVQKYVCETCGDSYEDKTPAESHEFLSEWVKKEVKHDETTKCLDHDIYTNKCKKCGETVERVEDVTRHQYIAKITKNATCVAKGEKQYVCKECGAVGEKVEIDIIPDAHNWDEGTKVGNVTTFHCLNEGCNETKTSVVAEEKNIEVSSADFAAVEEVQLSNAALAFDDASKELLEGKDLKIEVKETTAREIKIAEGQQIDIPAETKVYDFSITDNADQPLAFSGEEENSGKVTVRLPYEIQEGEDADNLIIYYVDSDGMIKEFEAKYENGFAVFETSHFSYYMVSYMTPAQACAKFGHRMSEEQVVEVTCTTRGYKFKVCERCGIMEIYDIQNPLGHSFVDDEHGAKEATCTEPGYSGKICEHCHEQYGARVEPLGHNYEQVDSKAPTCVEAGSITYKCSICEDTYVSTIAAKGHTYAPVTTAATCQKEGKIEYVCKDCGDIDATRTVTLEKLEHEYALDHETDDEYVYKCVYGCGEEKVISKNTAPLTEESVLHKHFFTNTGKSIEGKDISVHSGEFVMKINGQEYNFKAVDSEAHIGLDAEGKLIAYGSTNYEMGGQKASAAIYLVGNKLYCKADSGYGAQYMVYDLGLMGSEEFSLQELMDNIPELMDYINNDVKEFFNTVADFNDQDVNKTIYHLLNSICSIKSTPTGYDITLDFDKLATLNDKLTNKSVAEVIDYLLGEGKTQEFLNDLEQYTSLSLYDALAKLKADKGFDYEEFIRLIDKGVKITTGENTLRDYVYKMSNEEVDINEYLSEEYLKANSINSLVRDTEWAANFLDDKTLSEYIKKDIKEMLDKNLYELLVELYEADDEFLDDFKAHMVEYIDLLKTSKTKITLKLGENGDFVALNVVLDLKSDDVELSGDLQVYFGDGYHSVYDYKEIVRLAESVEKIVKEDRFSNKAQILSHFGTDAEIFTDEAGNVTHVKVESRKANDDYGYGNVHIEEYPGQNGVPSNYIKVETEQDLFSLYDRAYYKEIVEAYKEYKDKGQMEISLGSFSFYDISNFAPVNLSFYQVCGNKFNYNYYLSGEFEYFGSAAKVTVTDADGKEIYKNIFSSNHYTYESTYNNYNGAVDLASGQPIKGGKTEHSYVLVESAKEEDVKCGERVAAVYVCADCGAVRDESYIKDHSACSRDNIISETLVRPEYNYCGQGGVDITYKCDYCEEEITVRSYDHYQHKVNEFKTSLDTVITVYDCACGRDTSYEIDGYFEGGHSEYYYVQKQGEEERSGNYYAPYYPKDAEGDLKPIYVCWDESCTSACHYKKTMIVLEGCTYDPEAGLITYTSRSEFAIKEYESHSMPTYVWGSLKPVDETDLSKGYTYTEKCSSCGQEFVEVGLPGSTHALYISLADLGFENTRGYLYVVAEISEMYKLLTTKTALVREYGINAYGCDFQTDWNYDSELKAYWEDNHCAVTNEDGTACGFNYSECEERIEAQLEEHVGVSYRPVLIGCDENHKNAVYTLMTRYETFERHDYVEADPVTYDTDNENIKVVVHSTKCSVCDETSYYVSVALTDDKAYTETKTVTGEDGLTYVYEAGYKPTLGIGTMYVYDGDKIVKLVSSYVRCGGGSDYRYYEIQTRTITYGYYQGIKYTVSEIYEYHYYNSDGDVSDRSYGSRYYYAHENSDKFKELFLELTGFEYNVEKYGCYTIAENTNTDGSKYYRLTEAHLAMTPSHDHLYCTQSNEYKCVVCGKTTLKSPTGHKFSYDYTTDTFKCIVCGTQSKNAYNGSIVLENLTDLETGKITIGYCIRDEYSYQYVSPAFKDLNTYIYCTVTQMNGYTMNVNKIEYVDASDENSGKFEFDLESFMAKLPDNGINPKEIASIQIYIEGYYKGQYGGTNFYESIIFSAKEFGIDTRRYFVTFTSDQLDGECEEDAVLILDPEKELISIETEKGYRGGQLVDYNSQYFEGSFFDGYQSFRATYFDDDTGMYYLFVTSEFDEEKDEYVMHYFVEVEENPNPEEEEEEEEPSNPSNPSNPSQGEVSEPVSEGGQSEGGSVSEGGVSEGNVSEDGTSEGGFIIGESSEGNVAQEA